MLFIFIKLKIKSLCAKNKLIYHSLHKLYLSHKVWMLNNCKGKKNNIISPYIKQNYHNLNKDLIFCVFATSMSLYVFKR